jgi:hypothetical protein
MGLLREDARASSSLSEQPASTRGSPTKQSRPTGTPNDVGHAADRTIKKFPVIECAGFALCSTRRLLFRVDIARWLKSNNPTCAAVAHRSKHLLPTLEAEIATPHTVTQFSDSGSSLDNSICALQPSQVNLVSRMRASPGVVGSLRLPLVKESRKSVLIARGPLPCLGTAACAAVCGPVMLPPPR